jgi:hypothetical protein
LPKLNLHPRPHPERNNGHFPTFNPPIARTSLVFFMSADYCNRARFRFRSDIVVAYPLRFSAEKKEETLTKWSDL